LGKATLSVQFINQGDGLGGKGGIRNREEMLLPVFKQISRGVFGVLRTHVADFESGDGSFSQAGRRILGQFRIISGEGTLFPSWTDGDQAVKAGEDGFG